MKRVTAVFSVMFFVLSIIPMNVAFSAGGGGVGQDDGAAAAAEKRLAVEKKDKHGNVISITCTHPGRNCHNHSEL